MAFFGVAGIPFQHRPLEFTETGKGVTRNQHAPAFLLQGSNPIWFEALPSLSIDTLPAYNEVLHFARTILLINEQEQSEYWPVGVDCVFLAFGAPGSTQRRHAGTFPISILGTNDNPQPYIGTPTISYLWAECAACRRVTICADFGPTLGDHSGSTTMSCCGAVLDEESRPIRDSARLRDAVAAAARIRR
jgi:hypothetical protein